LVVYEVLKVLYSPVKAFEEIVKKPSVKGPLLVLALTLLATAVLRSVVASKQFVLTGSPEYFILTGMSDNDNWTESASLWTSNGVPSVDGADRVVGNYSVKAFVVNDTYIWMNITGIGQFNCSGEAGYDGVSFRIKWIHQNETFPSSNATLRLFSNNENYFELNLINLINSSDTWANLTVEVGSENPNWTSPNSPDWGNITGLEFRLTWLTSDAANLTMKIDDLHFGKYVSVLTAATSSVIIISSLNAAIAFFFNWAMYGVFLFILVAMFRGKTGSMTRFFVVIGHVFIVTTVYILVSALLFSTLPQVTAETIQEKWVSNWVYQLGIFLDFTFKAWMAVLFAIAIRFFSQLTWRKAAVVSAIASILVFILPQLLAVVE
jgi:hypothetical protein